MAVRFSSALENIKGSDLGPLLKLTAQPEVISFAGGLPAPQTFPVQELLKIQEEVLREDGTGALQYGPSRGYQTLRELIAARMNKLLGTKETAEDILVTAGSQQALDILGRVFLDPGDVVVVESPSYLGAVNAFELQQPRFIEVETDEQGMAPEELERVLASEPRVKMVYVIPEFQNPTGITWTAERRQAFMDIITRYEVPVIEDNPYGELRYEGETLPSLKSMDTKDLVVYLGTFSKTFCPGMRIGWVAAADPIMAKVDLVKQGTDLATSSISQREIAAYMQGYDFDAHVRENVELYRDRRDVMLNAMREYFPAGIQWTEPQGGLFIWVTLPEHIDARELFKLCIERKVAFVPGEAFFPSSKKKNHCRLNYSSMDPERIVEGIRRMSEALKEMI